MRKIVYYVASSIDGYISGPNGDISEFVGESDGLIQYITDLKEFDTVIMGRKTYEFGYKFGMKPGQVPGLYAHMNNYIFSDSLVLQKQDPQINVVKIDLGIIDKLRNQSGSDIYLCGGGKFAGWLLNNERIDILKIKLNPLIIGKGVPMFEGVSTQYQTELIDQRIYDKGLQIITYKIRYDKSKA